MQATLDFADSEIGRLLDHDLLLVERILELVSVVVGYEQANQYKLLSGATGAVVGYVAEEEGVVSAVKRQLLRTHRPVRLTVLSPAGHRLLVIQRPWYWIQSHFNIFDGVETLLGEVHEKWHPLRRRYELFSGRQQFGYVDEPPLSPTFTIMDGYNQPIARVDKEYTGLIREMLTDSTQYSISFGKALLAPESPGEEAEHHHHHHHHSVAPLGSGDQVEGGTSAAPSNAVEPIPKPVPLLLRERAVALGLALAVDFIHYSFHASNRGGLMSWLLPSAYFGSAGSPEAGPSPTASEQDGTGTDVGTATAAAGVAGTPTSTTALPPGLAFPDDDPDGTLEGQGAASTFDTPPLDEVGGGFLDRPDESFGDLGGDLSDAQDLSLPEMGGWDSLDPSNQYDDSRRHGDDYDHGDDDDGFSFGDFFGSDE